VVHTDPDNPVTPYNLRSLSGDTESSDSGNEKKSVTGVGILLVERRNEEGGNTVSLR
jgi:hypothetical protein